MPATKMPSPNALSPDEPHLVLWIDDKGWVPLSLVVRVRFLGPAPGPASYDALWIGHFGGPPLPPPRIVPIGGSHGICISHQHHQREGITKLKETSKSSQMQVQVMTRFK